MSERALAFVLEWEMKKIAVLGLSVSSSELDFSHDLPLTYQSSP